VYLTQKEQAMNSFVWFILIGLAAGWLAGRFLKNGFGVAGNLGVGVFGALVGSFLSRLLGLSAADGLLGSLIVATIGAVVFLLALRQLKRA
jgi:uncharacterized membrane protein YeaQ/YmgE (transglycosylase-associated protein family)